MATDLAMASHQRYSRITKECINGSLVNSACSTWGLLKSRQQDICTVRHGIALLVS